MGTAGKVIVSIAALVTIVGGFFGFWQLGVTSCRNGYEPLVELLKIKEADCQEENLRLKSRVQDLETEIKVLRAETLPEEPRVVRSLGEREYEVQLSVGTEAEIFGGAVSLKLLRVVFADNPPRFRAIASLRLPDGERAELEEVDAGFSTEQSGYRIETREVQPSSAVFRVTQISGGAR